MLMGTTVLVRPNIYLQRRFRKLRFLLSDRMDPRRIDIEAINGVHAIQSEAISA
jgi:hypothetical protein